MIKKVIFDLDNTLIMWKKDYINALIDTMKYFDVKKDPAIIDDIIESLEKKHEIISKEILLNDINKICGLNLDMNFIDKLFENQKKLAEIDDNLIEIIKMRRCRKINEIFLHLFSIELFVWILF